MSTGNTLRPLKWYKTLLTDRGRKESQAFLIEGARQVEQCILGSRLHIHEILCTDPQPWAQYDIPCSQISESQIRSITDVSNPSGVVAVAEIPADINDDLLPNEENPKIILLEDVQDPGNVGTLIRTAVAFGFTGVILTSSSASPFSPKVVRSTAGALGSLWIRRGDPFRWLDTLQGRGCQLIVADLAGDTTVDTQGTGIIFAFGNEGKGFSRELKERADCFFSIPYDSSAIESLNVAVAGGIALFLLGNQK